MRHHVTISSGRGRSAQGNARGLGWLSIGVGLAELLLPRATARAAGIQGSEGFVRGCGLRELATGVGILAARNPAPWVWARVGGDLLDLANLGNRMQRGNPQRRKTAVALAAVAGATLVDIACASALSTEVKRRRSRTVDYRQRSGMPRPPSEMRGAARQDFAPPADMQTPRGMRPYVVSDNAPR
jgi:hypothetical protein